jgi:DNA modification methylase
VILADARHLPFASGVVQCCVTSPPYWGLRDYGSEGQLGLERTPEEYVAEMVQVFREVRRVLCDDGVCWLNLGDSYAGSWGAQSREHAGKHAPNVSALSANQVKAAQIRESHTGSLSRTPGLKPKDLVGIPWRVAFALQADGWYLRSDVIWSKPNPMPESVIDRPTKAHEYVFLLTKSEQYMYDSGAITETAASASQARYNYGFGGSKNVHLMADEATGVGTRTRLIGSRTFTGMRNARSVWSIATQPYSGAHFAVMPEALARRCILAGSRHGDLVLDPFLGSGTVARVAISLGRRAVGCDLQRAYMPLQQERMAVTRGLPLEHEASA